MVFANFIIQLKANVEWRMNTITEFKKKKKNGDGNIVFLVIRDLSWYMSFFVFCDIACPLFKKKQFKDI